MRKNAVRLSLCVMLSALSPVAEAQQPKAYRIGVIVPGGPLHDVIDGLRDGLRELGLEEGKQYALTVRDTKGDTKVANEAARSFEREKVNLIYAVTTPMITTAKEATTNMPIVFCIGSDPVAGGLVDSFPKPGGRLTGIHYLARDLTGKRLEILKEILPKIGRVLTFYDPSNQVAADGATLARDEAKRLGLKFIERHVASIEDLQKGLQALKAGEADAFLYSPDAMVASQAQSIIDTGRTKKLPTMFQDRTLVAKGGLASYGQNYYQIGWLSAKYVERVLSGTPPKDLKIDTIDNVELAINLQTARQLGLTVPAQVLARANKVIK
jgi:putative tryptophan/tyrosine transport system substrate-binding protein